MDGRKEKLAKQLINQRIWSLITKSEAQARVRNANMTWTEW